MVPFRLQICILVMVLQRNYQWVSHRQISDRRAKELVVVETFELVTFLSGSFARSDFTEEVRYNREDPKTGKYTSV